MNGTSVPERLEHLAAGLEAAGVEDDSPALLRQAADELRRPRARVDLPNGVSVEVDALGLSIERAAELAGIGKHEFRALVRCGRVGSVAVGENGGRRVVPVSRLAEFLHDAAAPAATEGGPCE
jgi:hypothetical protein